MMNLRQPVRRARVPSLTQGRVCTMSLRLLPLAILVPLAACGQGGSQAPTNTVVPENGYSARMASMNEGERNGVLFRAIRDAGQACQGVTRSQAIDPVQGKPAWVATCDDGTPWLVVIGNDGIAAVTNARVAAGKAG
jgi:hypothetical protein